MEIEKSSYDKWEAIYVDFDDTTLEERQKYINNVCRDLAVADASSLTIVPLVGKEVAFFYKKARGSLDLNE